MPQVALAVGADQEQLVSRVQDGRKHHPQPGPASGHGEERQEGKRDRAHGKAHERDRQEGIEPDLYEGVPGGVHERRRQDGQENAGGQGSGLLAPGAGKSTGRQRVSRRKTLATRPIAVQATRLESARR